MKLLYLTYKKDEIWDTHYLYPVFQGESGKIFSAKNYFLLARTKESLYKRAEYYPYKIK